MGLFNRKKADTAKNASKKNGKLFHDKDEKVAEEKKTISKKAVKTAVKKEGNAKKEIKKVSKTGTTKKGSAYKVLIKPLVTEKVANMGTESKYVFEVSVDANKIEVAKAVEEVYGEKPVSVNIMNYNGKKVVRGKIAGRRKDWRKAIVTLAKGTTINIYEGI